MEAQSFLLDTNILIGLEDNHEVENPYANFQRLVSEYNCKLYVHEASKEDIAKDSDSKRKRITTSKMNKYQILRGMQGLSNEELSKSFGKIKTQNDLIDCKLLHSLNQGTVDFLVTEDRGIRRRAERCDSKLSQRVLFVGDAVGLLIQNYEPTKVPLLKVKEIKANQINIDDPIFDSLQERYLEFKDWWQEKCVRQHRYCWVVFDGKVIAGLIVRKDEKADEADVETEVKKIMKICTFKVSSKYRGIKLGELLLKQVLWFSHSNEYELAYLTTFDDQPELIELLEFYGFENSGEKNNELIFARSFSQSKLILNKKIPIFEQMRKNYPRLPVDNDMPGFVVPIKEKYHDTLFPDLQPPPPDDLFTIFGEPVPQKAGNTIRKVYLCRAPLNPDPSGSILFFYKSRPSQALTVLGIFESAVMADSLQNLLRLTGGHSVYSMEELEEWNATLKKPVKVINFLLVTYLERSIPLDKMKEISIRPPQSITKLGQGQLSKLMNAINLD